MIFVTVGTTPFPFRRMHDMVEQMLANADISEDIVFQHGATLPVFHTSVKNFASLPYTHMKMYIKKARIVISHGGPATIFLVHSCGKIPIVIPRERTFHEHVDNHQVYFFSLMKKNGLVRDIKEINNAASRTANTFRKQSPDRSLIRHLILLTNMQ